MIIEQSTEWNSSLCVNFIDFEKPFDSLEREILTLIKICIVVIHGGDTSEEFEIKTGVEQRCLLSPFWVFFIIDWIMRESTPENRNRIQWNFMNQLDDLDFLMTWLFYPTLTTNLKKNQS